MRAPDGTEQEIWNDVTGMSFGSWESNREGIKGTMSTKCPSRRSNNFRPWISLLTRREEDVVRLVADGPKNREIAQRLKVKEHSIRNYIYRIFEKLGVSSRVELILYVFSHRDSSQ